MKEINDEHQSITFLKSLYQHCDEGFINLQFIPKDKESVKPIIQKFSPISEIESIPKILKNYIDQYHCYFAVATRINKDGSKDGIIQIPALWVDLDLYKLSDRQKEIFRQLVKPEPGLKGKIMNKKTKCTPEYQLSRGEKLVLEKLRQRLLENINSKRFDRRISARLDCIDFLLREKQ